MPFTKMPSRHGYPQSKRFVRRRYNSGNKNIVVLAIATIAERMLLLMITKPSIQDSQSQYFRS